MPEKQSRQWFVTGTVQGVGFRAFVSQQARNIGLVGRVRNLDDGRVYVHATGSRDQLDELAGQLHRGPVASRVRGVEEQEAAVQQLDSFRQE